MSVPHFPIGGTAAVLTGASIVSTAYADSLITTRVAPIPIASLTPVQVVGLVPMSECTDTECRDWTECCYQNIVFANTDTGVTDFYYNDVNSFLIDVQLKANNPSGTSVSWTIEEYTNGSWVSIATITNQAYGAFYAFNTLGTAYSYPWKNYTGVQISWKQILINFGEGIYRIKAVVALSGTEISKCFVSEDFCLRTWTCIEANRTVKFESWITGYVGDINNDGKVFNMCGFSWYDSVRVPGFFGYESTEYDETLLEYNTGLIQRIRDEAIQKFQFKSQAKGLPKVIIDRLKVYGFMADSLKVSDYNYNNSDYNIRRKLIVKAGGVAPNYKTTNRMASIVVDFKEGTQQVIKGQCCDVRGI